MTAPPRIDIVIVRDPDCENSVTVYLDGVATTEYYEWEFDPGAGYEKEDYEEMRDSDIDLAPDFLKPVIKKLYADLLPTFKRWATGGWS